MYQVKLVRDVKKQLKRFPSKDQERIGSRIRQLANDPRPVGSIHLRDVVFRIRVGDYRVIYAVYDQILVVIVVEVARRSEATYEDLEKYVQRARRFFESE
ncbi:MAG: type II toxin-antitoxin system RelE/ParE family toxin [Anaerolineales bacterium]